MVPDRHSPQRLVRDYLGASPSNPAQRMPRRVQRVVPLFLAGPPLRVVLWAFDDGGGICWYGNIFGMPLAFLGFLVLTIVCAIHSVRLALRRSRRQKSCSRCGYLLKGLTVPRCPECGTPFPETLLERGSDAEPRESEQAS